MGMYSKAGVLAVRKQLDELEDKLEEIRQSSEYRYYLQLAKDLEDKAEAARQQDRSPYPALLAAAKAVKEVCREMVQHTEYWSRLEECRLWLEDAEFSLAGSDEEFEEEFDEE